MCVLTHSMFAAPACLGAKTARTWLGVYSVRSGLLQLVPDERHAGQRLCLEQVAEAPVV